VRTIPIEAALAGLVKRERHHAQTVCITATHAHATQLMRHHLCLRLAAARGHTLLGRGSLGRRWTAGGAADGGGAAAGAAAAGAAAAGARAADAECSTPAAVSFGWVLVLESLRCLVPRLYPITKHTEHSNLPLRGGGTPTSGGSVSGGASGSGVHPLRRSLRWTAGDGTRSAMVGGSHAAADLRASADWPQRGGGSSPHHTPPPWGISAGGGGGSGSRLLSHSQEWKAGGNGGSAQVQVEVDVLAWANAHLERIAWGSGGGGATGSGGSTPGGWRPLRSLDDPRLADGTTLLRLLEAVAPGCVPAGCMAQPGCSSSSKSLSDALRLAVSVARKIGVSLFLSPADIDTRGGGAKARTSLVLLASLMQWEAEEAARHASAGSTVQE
jgi:hypothetical protein